MKIRFNFMHRLIKGLKKLKLQKVFVSVLKKIQPLKVALERYVKMYRKQIKKRDKKTIVVSAIVVIVLLAGSVYIITNRSNDAQFDGQMPVATDVVKRDAINIKTNFTGKIRTSESVVLTAEVIGKIVSMKKDGSLVKKGEVILQLDSTEAEGKYMVALGKKNEEEMKLHMTELMVKEGYKTQNHLIEQKSRYQTAQGHLMEAKAYLNKHVIRAPFNGVIGLQNQSIGATVNQHTKLVSVTNLENLQVEFLVSESELRNLGGIDRIKDAGILVTLDGHLLPINAIFSAYETVIDAETNAIAVRATLQLEDGKTASPGQIGKVVVNIGAKEDVLTVPESSIENEYGIVYVYRIANGIAVKTPVKIGVKDGQKVEVISGVEEGDVIITSGQHRLYDGQSVKSEDSHVDNAV